MDVSAFDRSFEAMTGKILAAVWRRKTIFVLTSVVVFFLLMAKVLAEQPLYEGVTLLIGGQSELGAQISDRRKDTETPIALLSSIAASDEVVRAAIASVGANVLADDSLSPVAGPSHMARLREFLYPGSIVPSVPASSTELDTTQIKSAITVRGDQTAGIIRIAFRYPDPIIAAKFTDALANAFVERQAYLYSRPGTADFFSQQRQRFEAEIRNASSKLETFSTQTSLYSVTDQRRLLLERQNLLSLELAKTLGTISQKKGERQSLADSLRKLAPVSRSPYVSSLVDSLGGDRTAPKQGDSRIVDDRSSDPPMLLIRVYQESMASLFKLNSDLTGAQNLAKQQMADLESLAAQLGQLAENEGQFLRLKRAVDEAVNNLDVYSKKMVEEQVNGEMSTARFSPVKILQKARIPGRPASPNYPIMAAMALIASVVVATGICFLLRYKDAPMMSYTSEIAW